MLMEGSRNGGLSDAVRLKLPEDTIFGRRSEMLDLQSAIESCSRTRGTSGIIQSNNRRKEGNAKTRLAKKNPKLVLVGGACGTGKSHLVKVALDSFARNEKGGFLVVKGKFDQFSASDTAYSAVLDAMNELCDRIAADLDNRNQLLEKIKTSLGENLALLTTFIPALGKIIDANSESVSDTNKHEIVGERTVDATASHHCRFASLCCSFIEAIASPERPVILAIDDLQWADVDSLQVLRSLLAREEIDGFLIVGTYRNDEVNEDHILETHLKEMIDANKVPVKTILIDCLTESSVNALVASVTSLPRRETVDLSRVIYRKTLGNCFFINQLLEVLQDHGSLSYSFQDYKWVWQIDEINHRTNISSNVVDVVLNRITKLDATTQTLFEIFGCLGKQCPVRVLDVVASSIVDTASNITSTTTSMAVGKLVSMNLVEECKNDWIKFSHDRVQQAAEMWISNDEKAKAEFHLKVGRVLLKQYMHTTHDDKPTQDWLLYTTADQLNRGSSLISDPKERSELLELNREAAETAQQRSAFLPAAGYFVAAMAAMGETVWKTDPDNAFQVHVAAATCYLRCGRSEKAFKLFEEVLQYVTDPARHLKVKTLQIEALSQQRRFDEGKAIGLDLLKSMDECFPTRLHDFHVIRGLYRTKRLLQKYTDQELLNLPTMTDKHQFKIMQLIHSMDRLLFPAKDKSVLPLMWFRNIEKFLTFGRSSYACAALTAFAALLFHIEDTKLANRISSLALQLAETVEDKGGLPFTYTVNYGLCSHWQRPLQSLLDPLMNNYTVALEMGDMQSAGVSSFGAYFNYSMSGLDLRYAEKDLRKLRNVLEDSNLRVVKDLLVPLHQRLLISTGVDRVADPCELTGSEMNEAALLKEMEETGSFSGMKQIYSYKLRQCFEFGNNAGVLKCYKKERAKKFAKDLSGHFGNPSSVFYTALAAMSIARQSRSGADIRYARRLLRKLELFVKAGNMNCAHMLLIARAEMMTLQKKQSYTYLAEVKRSFDEAISAAHRSGFNNDAGFANERAALWLMRRDDHDQLYAEDYWKAAHERFSDWGALLKVEHLESQHSCLREMSTQQAGSTATNSQSSSGPIYMGSITGGGHMNARSRFKESVAKQHLALRL